jgi:uncharacterized protein (TIGR03435 family)
VVRVTFRWRRGISLEGEIAMLRSVAGICMLLSVSGFAQSFEVASIKRSAPQSGDHQFTGFQTPGGGRLNTLNTPLRMLVTFAYNVKDFQLSGGPGWASSETYDITAKAADNANMAQLRAMLQTLLKERFKLAVRHETKEAPIYQLVVAKGGSKLTEDTTSAKLAVMMTGRGKVTVQKAPITAFLPMLGTLTGRPVVDKTGLPSAYAFDLNWTPDPGEGGFPQRPGAQDIAPADANGPSLFTALQEQLGLRLESAKAPVESVVIESAEKPSEN